MSFIETKLRGKAASVFTRRNSPPSKDMFKEESGNKIKIQEIRNKVKSQEQGRTGQ